MLDASVITTNGPSNPIATTVRHRSTGNLKPFEARSSSAALSIGTPFLRAHPWHVGQAPARAESQRGLCAILVDDCECRGECGYVNKWIWPPSLSIAQQCKCMANEPSGCL